MISPIVLESQAVFKSYQQGTEKLQILNGLDLQVREKESLVILGSSGAGKSTFLQILGSLDKPDSGEVWICGEKLSSLKDSQRAHLRNQKIGFVFQFHHLIQEMTALENVLLPVKANPQLSKEIIQFAEARAADLFQDLDINHRKNHYPSELSGGELQRVSIARALINRPQILLADEPTGNLDSENGKKVQDLFFNLQNKYGLALVIVTHDLQFAQRFPRVLRMKDGRWV
ncbi:MAG: ABC transporter ATP-binding protein [Pseudobdellovibrionaceae bacterium]|jgi:lipoprotein-releasing system ATP-binding protein